MKTILRKSIIYLIGNFSAKILSSLIIPIYAVYLSSSALGEFDYIQTLMNIIGPIATVAIWESVLKFNLDINSSEKNKRELFSNAVFVVLISSMLIILSLLIYNSYFSIFKTSVFLSITMILLTPYLMLFQYFSRSINDTATYVYSGIISSLINFSSILFFVVYLNKGVSGLILSYVLGQISGVILIGIRTKIIQYIDIQSVSYKTLRKMILFSTPLAINSISLWLINGLSRIIITNSFGLEANGEFAFAAKFSTFLSLFAGVINMALIEEAIINSKEKNFSNNFQRNFNFLAEMFLYLAILFLPIIFIFFTFIQHTDFVEAYSFVPIIMLGSVFSILSTNLGALFQAIEKTRLHSISTITGGLFFIIMSYSMMPSLGVYSVALGQMIGFLTMFLVRLYFAKKLVGINFKKNLLILLIFYLCVSYFYIEKNKLLLFSSALIVFLFINKIWKYKFKRNV
jgi:O-antigen/teichoic acid export membrane protein